jgi:hypothetical protein
MTGSNPKQSGSKGTANASHVDRDIIERVQGGPSLDGERAPVTAKAKAKSKAKAGVTDLEGFLAEPL